MNPTIAWFLARRGLRESPLSTALVVVAVAVGVGFEVPSTANIEGYRAELLAQSLDSGFGDVRVRPKRGAVLKETAGLVTRLARVSGVTEVDRLLAAPASVRAHGHVVTLSVAGDDARATMHPYRLTSGSPLVEGEVGVLLGVSVARTLEVSIGDDVEVNILLSTYPRLVLDDGGYGTYALTVRGLVGFSASDSAFVERSFLAAELGETSAASVILLHIRDHEAAPGIAAAINRVEPGVLARAWMDDSLYLRSSVQAARTLSRASWGMGVLAVGIPVLALLYISTLQRRRQIGLLTAMGFTRADLFLTFLFQALILGTAGVVAGGAMALALVRYLMAHPIFNWQGFVVRPALTVADFATTAAAILATAVAAGTYPAWRAARMDPSRILRGIE